jgi:hypothetical protein
MMMIDSFDSSKNDDAFDLIPREGGGSDGVEEESLRSRVALIFDSID